MAEPISYLPEVAWEAVLSNVEQLTPTTYKLTAIPLDPNEPGSGVAVVGYLLTDFIGHKYTITAVDGNDLTVDDDFITGFGPQSDRPAIVCKTVDNAFIAPIRHERLDESSMGYSRAIELDVMWKSNLHLDQTTPQTITGGAPIFQSGLSSGGQMVSTLATGTSPLAVTSTALNLNLNADLLDGQHGSYYEPAFTKNTGFNKNFGTTAGTVLEGRTFGSIAGSDTGDYLPIGGGTLTGTLNAGNYTYGQNISVFSSSYGNNGLLRFYGTDNAEKMQIGVTSTGSFIYNFSSAPLSVITNTLNIGEKGITADASIQIGSSPTTTGNIFFGDGIGASIYRGYIQYDHNTDELRLGASGVTKLTIVGSTSNVTCIGSVTAQSFKIPGGTSAQYMLADGSVTTSSGAVYKDQVDGSNGVPISGGSALANGTGTTGWYYACSTAGTYNYGGGNITLAVGDQIYYNGTIWIKIPGAGSYTLPIATSSVLGGVKSSASVAVDGSGVMSVSTAYDATGTASGLFTTHNSTYNHANIENGQTAYGWGNHTGLYLPIGGGTLTGNLKFSSTGSYFVENNTYAFRAVFDEDYGLYFDATNALFAFKTADASNVFSIGANSGNLITIGTISALSGTSTQWNTAYGWGNHASAGYGLVSALTTHAALTTTAHGLGASAFHADAYFELAFLKNTGFNKNFGSATGTVLEGRTFGSAANSATTDFLAYNATAVNSALLENHNAAYFQVAGSYEPANVNIQSHISSASNPHGVTKAQVGLTNVTDNAQWYSGNHPTTVADYGLPAYPTTLPASDVYSWAKEATKPAYGYGEISGTPTLNYLPLTGGELTGNLNVGNSTTGKQISVFSSSYGNNGVFNAYGTDGVLKLQLGANSHTIAYIYTPPGVGLDFLTSAATFSGSVTATSFIKSGGTSAQYLLADGSVANIITNNNQLSNGSGYITGYTETDPVFTAWNKSTGISITKSQVSDFPADIVTASADTYSSRAKALSMITLTQAEYDAIGTKDANTLYIIS